MNYTTPPSPPSPRPYPSALVFWILWNPNAKIPPTVRFNTYKEAFDVAKKMAMRHHEQFYVLKAQLLVEPPAGVKTTELV